MSGLPPLDHMAHMTKSRRRMPTATISPNFKALLMEWLCHDLLHNVNRVAYQQGAIDYCGPSERSTEQRDRHATHTIICDFACVSGSIRLPGGCARKKSLRPNAAEFG